MAQEQQIRAEMLSRAEGCLLGQLAGDALGSLVEFRFADQIKREYPNGVRTLVAGGTWNTLAGQPTDDSEMALMLARTLAENGKYDADKVRSAYLYWLDSNPFDCGMTVSNGLCGRPNLSSQANGALMRISPLGIFGASHDLQQVAEWARQDAALTHPNPACVQADALFVMAIAHAVRTGVRPEELFALVEAWAAEMNVERALKTAIAAASTSHPANYILQQGWVVTALHNALWQLLHAPNLEEGVVDTVMHGGDTDTNAAIAGALLGAVHGRDAVPQQWVDALLNCRPEAGQPNVNHPRPPCFWPVDVLDLAKALTFHSVESRF